ncbi:o-succinylbenzoate--CoA ligase [Okibacterium endophyticum]
MTRTLIAASADDPLELLGALRSALDRSGQAIMPVVGAPPHPDRVGTVPQPVGVVIATSGSTGVPKRVALSCDALLAGAGASATTMGGQGQWLLALPAHYIAGLQVLVRSIAAETVPVVLTPGRFTPADFIEASRAMRGERHYTSLVPVQLARLLESRSGVAALRRFDGILVGGQATPPALRDRIELLGLPVFRTYGSSETCGGCVYNGVPLPGVHVRITDGKIELAGPVLAEGYLGDDALTRAVFVEDDGQRWYRTGDTGEFADGVLRVTGRADNVIVSGGVNVSLDRVEQVVRGIRGMSEAVVVGMPDERWGEVPVVVVAGAHPRFEVIAQTVADALGTPSRPAKVISVETLPTLVSGKPDRHEIAALAREA